MTIGEYLQGLSQEELGGLLTTIQNDIDFFEWVYTERDAWIAEMDINSVTINISYAFIKQRSTINCSYNINTTELSSAEYKILFYSRFFKITSYFLEKHNPHRIHINGKQSDYSDSLALWNSNFFTGFSGYVDATTLDGSDTVKKLTYVKG